jgi:hypothetical protein
LGQQVFDRAGAEAKANDGDGGGNDIQLLQLLEGSGKKSRQGDTEGDGEAEKTGPEERALGTGRALDGDRLL